MAKLMKNPAACFVFGSNLAGRHGAGAAYIARVKYGAIQGQGFGLMGRSYAIPTKDREIKTLPLGEVHRFVDTFLFEAGMSYRDLTFVVTRIGCGLAGFRDEQIAPLFKGATANCILPTGWREYNGE